MRSLNKEEVKEIEKFFKYEVKVLGLIKETDSSFLLLIESKKQKYVFKKNIDRKIVKDFENHKTVYKIWKKNFDKLDFFVPRPYFLSEKRRFYVMEYIEESENFQDLVLQKDLNSVEGYFRKIGFALNQYHSVLTKELKEKRSIKKHNTIRIVLNSKYSEKIKKNLEEMDKDSYRIIFKDFKPSNIVFNKKGDLYLIDFQLIDYFAPFYYDLCRFIDTVKVFSFLKKPVWFLRNKKRFDKLNNVFLEGYNKEIEKSKLRKMHKVHQTEHVFMKLEKGRILDGNILKIIYKFI